MPMKLRDGSYYLPCQSRHMILRDGKAVQSFQASIFNNLFHGPFVWNQNYHSVPPSPLSVVQHDTISEEITNDEVCPSRGDVSGSYPPHQKQQQPLSHVRSQKLSVPTTHKSRSDTHQPGDLLANRWIDHSPKFTQSSDEVFAAANSFGRGPRRNDPLRSGCAKRCAPVMELSSLYVGKDEKQRRFSLSYHFIIFMSIFSYAAQKVMQLTKSSGHFFQQIVFAVSQFWLIGKQTVIFILVKFKFRSSLSKSRDLRRESVYGFRTVYKSLNIIIVLFPIAAAVILLTGYHINSTHRNDITDLDLPNTVQMTIPTQKENIKFWHVAPSDKHYQEETAIENLNDGQPIIIHLRDDETGNIFHRLNVFKALSKSGFHVLVPVEPLQKLDFVTMWASIKNTVTFPKHNAMYIWSDMKSVADTKDYVNILTKMGLFPKGVVIEKTIRDKFDSVRNLEIWRGGMRTTEDFFWNYLKCPLTVPTGTQNIRFLSDEVSLCVSAISFNPDFKVRY